jgi:glycosyltransferase involved in cell wall biosynthesis
MAIELSIIIPARGNAPDLTTCIESLARQKTSINHEVIVAYCNKDMDIHDVVSLFPFVQAATADEYLLPGPARNLGAAMAKANVLAFIDSDCKLQEDWMEAACHTIQSGAVLCSGVIQDTYPWDLIASSDNRLQYADFPSGRPYGPARYFPAVHIVVHRDAFNAVGGFGNSTNAQDVLFTMEIARHWPSQTIFNPKIVASHAGRRTWNGLLKHHKAFGYARALHQIQINNSMSWMSQHRWLGWLVFLRRFVYITFRVIQWNTKDLIRYFLQMPFIITGLFAWTAGYYQGMRSNYNEENNEKSSFTRA